MMFNIDRNMLIKIASNSQALIQGASYLYNGRVLDVCIEDDMVHAQVQGKERYNVTLYFNYGFLKHFECSCRAFKDFGGACEHIIAVLFYLQVLMKNSNANENFKVEDEILGRLSLNQAFETKKSEVKVDYEMVFFPFQGLVARMNMKIGPGRMYILRDVKGFLKSLYENKPFTFGKQFVFNPLLHQFSPEDQKVFENLLEIYEIEKSLEDILIDNKYFFNERYVNLPYPYLRKIAAALKNTPVVTKISGSYTTVTATFEVGKLPCGIKLEQIDGGVAAKLDEDVSFLEINTCHSILLKDDKIFLCDKDDPAFILFKGFFNKNNYMLKFEGERGEKLLSLIPKLTDSENIHVDKGLAQLYERASMKLKMTIDKYKKGLSIDVKFMYSEQEISPNSKGEVKNEKIIVREYDKEQFVLKLLEDSGFEQRQGKFILEDEDKVYNFAKNIAPRFTQLGDVYYTKEVKNIFDIKPPSHKSVLKSVKGNLLEIDVKFDNIDTDQVENLLKAVKEKKRYYRLKDGSFISLEDESIKDLGNVLTDVDKNEIDDNILRVSKYKMLGIMQKFQDKESFPIENTNELRQLIDNVVNLPESKLIPPVSLSKILRNYQTTGFKWMKVLGENGLGGVLADDMGLGKTIQAISFMLSNKDKGLPSLVVAPSTLVYNWEREIKKFAPSLSTLSIEGNKNQREEKIKQIPKYDIIITSYPLLRNDIDFYTEFDFYSCILDEAQHIKNPISITAKSVKKIKAHTRFALTGTPIENSPGELWSIFDFVMPGYLGLYKSFEQNYQKPILDGDEEALNQLKKLISPFVLRRSKEQVLKELPEKIVTTYTVDLTPAQRKLYNTYLVKTKGELEDRIKTVGFEKSRMHIFTGLLRLRQICCHPGVFIENYKGSSGKIEALEELLGDMVAAGHRILIFSQFTSMLTIIKNMLEKMNISYAYLDGATKVAERKKIVDQFNQGKSNVFLLSLKAGGVGLNLTSADTVIHFDPWWNPAVEEQASDRVHRIGQKRKVNVIRLIAKDTIEERIDELQKIKKDLADSVIQDGELLINTLTKEEILELFNCG